jgi:hypothetical protein
MKKKTVTIEDLALMVHGEFDSMGKTFGKRLDRLEGSVNRLEENDKLILKRLEGMIYRTEFEQLEIRVSELENLLAFDSKKH